jgi:hypothetical protein
MMRIKVFTIIILALMVLGACGPQESLQAEFANGSQAWIDAPLPGSSLPLAAVEIVAHAASPDGIASFEINLNGQLLAKTVPDTASIDQTLMYTRYSWQPAAPGSYLIEVRAFDRNNQPGPPAQVVVEVGGPTPSPTPTLTPTPTPTSTATLTLTPSPTPTPTVTPRPGPSPIVFINQRVNTSPIFVGRNGCGRKEVDIYITIPADSEVTQVSIKYRMVDNENNSHTTDWVTDQMRLVSSSATEWIVSVAPEREIPGASGFLQARLEYQFGATNANGIESSEIYTNVEVDYCRTP